MNNNYIVNFNGKEETINFSEIKKEIEREIEKETNKEKNNSLLTLEMSMPKYEFTVELIKNILKRREEKGLTQSDLSKLSNVNRTTITKMENFQRIVVNLDIIIRLLDSLDLKLTIEEK